MELLVVMGIIALLAVVSLPAIRGISKSNAMAAANRQLLDDVALARQYALSTRSEVYMIFAPPLDALTASDKANILQFVSPQQQQVVLRGQQTAYALFSRHSVGDQPGQENPRYLTSWRFLPEGVFIPAYMFTKTAVPVNGVFPFLFSASVPFPVSSVPFGRVISFYVKFAPEGGLAYARDEIIPLAQGSVLLARNPGTGGLAWAQADILERPPNNSIVNSNHIRIDWLTGRARVERAEIQ
jgi:type II secretory pathway pseudopilin PulG